MIGRVTQQTVQRSTLTNLQTNLSAMSDLQNRLSGNKRITKPSDDPAGTASALALRSSLRQIEQHDRNIADGIGWLTTIDTALTTSVSLVGKARDLTVQGSNTGSLTPEARVALAVEIEGLRDNLLAQANSTYLGRSVFAGTSDAESVYARDSTAGPVAYTAGPAKPNPVERRVNADTTIRVDVEAREAFGSDDDAGSVFATLDLIAASLRSGTGNPSDHLAALDGHRDDMLRELSGVGARHNQVLAAQSNALTIKTELTGQLGAVEDADLAASIVELQMQEVAYKAALGATSRVLQPTLMDFLR
ncbi:flagellar hook-associated protein FlgL [Cellulomonas aerilata]|uniref:Flagellar hook-associated protein FlgL n=1 Tax=Cellulomonas aerilata TaxID=515326 RepID=A0A512DED7_9CELL|nr:flagellar hook-associated protein FlgL [Cellulomonas aerilata]GEO34827.1 flagellar hook-associated protein FlgL [Cellulomonas aerilata]